MDTLEKWEVVFLGGNHGVGEDVSVDFYEFGDAYLVASQTLVLGIPVCKRGRGKIVMYPKWLLIRRGHILYFLIRS